MNKSATITLQINITEHAFERGKERVGLNARAFQSLVVKAYVSGKKHADTKGQLKQFISGLYLQYKKANNTRIYGNHIYLFCNQTLITVYHIPNDLKSYIKL